MEKNKKLTISEKLDKILKNEEQILENESKILQTESNIEKLETEEIILEKEAIKLEKKDLYEDSKTEKTEEEILAEVEKLEVELEKSKLKTLKKITKRDLLKGFVGAFFGIMGHFAFYKGYDISQGLTITKTIILYIVAFVIISLMLYSTGFRKVEKQIVLKIMPLRAIVLYLVSIVTIILVNLMYGKIHFPLEFLEIFKLVGASIILAVIGAGTADLIGGQEE